MLIPLSAVLMVASPAPKPPSIPQQAAVISLPYINKYIPAVIKAVGKLKRKKK